MVEKSYTDTIIIPLFFYKKNFGLHEYICIFIYQVHNSRLYIYKQMQIRA